MEPTSYMSLDALATRLGLPRTYLREQATQGAIPYLRVGGRLRFEESAVREALRLHGGQAQPGKGADHAD